MEVGYVGSHSTHLTLGQPTINIDALNPIYLSKGSAALDAQVPNPFFGVPGVAAGTLSGSTVGAYQLLLPYPAYTGINEIFGDNNHASYNSMVVKAQKRFSRGLTFLSTFTWSKNMDESSGGVGTSLNGGAQGSPQNPYNTAAEYSLSNVDTPLRWATAISYQLPIGRGKELWNINSRALDLIVGGWVVNSVSVYETGFPLQIYQTNLNSAYGYGAQRPNATARAPAPAAASNRASTITLTPPHSLWRPKVLSATWPGPLVCAVPERRIGIFPFSRTSTSGKVCGHSSAPKL